MEYHIDKKNKAIFGFSAKAGCSHIKTILYYASSGVSCRKINSLKRGEIHKVFRPRPTKKIEPYIKSTSEKINVIIIARHPFERLVSGFLDKYANKSSFAHKWPPEIKLNLSNFVKEIQKDNWEVVEPNHFKPQSTYYLDFSKYKHIELKIFDIKNIDYDYISRVLNKKIPLDIINKTQGHERSINEKDFAKYEGEFGHGEELEVNEYFSSKIDVSTFYSDQIKKEVYEIFKQDYINFGYRW